MRAKNIGALIGVVLISGAVLVVSGGHSGNRLGTANARMTAQVTRIAPPENKHHAVAPVGQRGGLTTNAEREPIVSSRNVGITAPTGETDSGHAGKI